MGSIFDFLTHLTSRKREHPDKAQPYCGHNYPLGNSINTSIL